MKIAVFGVGFLGLKLMRLLSRRFKVVAASRSPHISTVQSVDAEDICSIERFILTENPDIVISTVALSSYFLCEGNPEICMSLNYKTTKNISDVCKKLRKKFIFISSSYVFDGKKGDYSELDVPNSRTSYAQSKIKAERAVLEIENSIVLRLELLYGIDDLTKKIKIGTNSVERGFVIGYPNLLRRPVFVDDIPVIIEALISRNAVGIFHVAGPEKVSWLYFVTEIAKKFNVEDKVKMVEKSSWSMEPPHDSSLTTCKINSLGIKTTYFEDALRRIVAESKKI
jgi:dTDP-4-dehydrorhamnose reductase